MARDRGLPVVVVTWGGEKVILHGLAFRGLAEHQYELEKAVRDGGPEGPGTHFEGPRGQLIGAAAHEASVSLCLKALHKLLDRRIVPALSEPGEDGPGRP